MQEKLRSSLAALCLLCATTHATAQYQTRFDQPVYRITRGQSFQVQVIIDPVPESGLASYGVTIGFPSANAAVSNAFAIGVPAELDFNGVRGTGALRSSGADFAAVKGTVDFAVSPASDYRSGALATIQVQDLGVGPYPLTLSPFNTLGVSEEIFVSGTGNALDPLIAFGSAMVEYLAPPQESPYAIFAGESECGQPPKSRVLYFKGKSNKVTGRIHSNSGITVGGSCHVFRQGLVEYVTTIFPTNNFGDKVTFENSTLSHSTNQPYPVNFVSSRYAPGGVAASAAQAAGKYYRVRPRGKVTDLASHVKDGVLREGLYYVEGSVVLNSDCIVRGRVTIVATGRIDLNLKGALLESYTDNLLAFSPYADCDSPTIKLAAQNNRWLGISFAPNGLLEVHGKNKSDEWSDQCHDDDRDDCEWQTANTSILGALVAKRVRVNAKNLQITGLDITNAPPHQLIPPLQCVARGKDFRLCFKSAAGMSYAIEYSDSLTKPDWRLWCVAAGTGGEISLTPPVGGVAQRFYRVRLQ